MEVIYLNVNMKAIFAAMKTTQVVVKRTAN